MVMGRFEIVGEDAIRDGRCTDIYFRRVVDVMERTASTLVSRWR